MRYQKIKIILLSQPFLTKIVKCIRQNIGRKNKNSSFIGDFGITNKFKSLETNEENSISHIFADFDLNLNLENF